nr:MAG TPA: hypothetical protein [Caudoviricetes sp.]
MKNLSYHTSQNYRENHIKISICTTLTTARGCSPFIV